MKQPDPIGTSRKISAIPYYGGKFRLARHIVPIIESIPHIVYCEPCIGGASVFLWRSPDDSKIEVINDINSDIVNIYRAFKLYPKSIIKNIESIPYSTEVFKTFREVWLNRSDKQSVIDSATSAYFRLCTAFGNGLYIGGMNFDRNGESFPRRWKNKKSIISKIVNRFDCVYLENGDLINIIKRWDHKNALFFIDPPYDGTYNDPYGFGFDMQDLLNLLDTIKANYILCNYRIEPPKSANLICYRTVYNTVDRDKVPTEFLYIKCPDREMTIKALGEGFTQI